MGCGACTVAKPPTEVKRKHIKAPEVVPKKPEEVGSLNSGKVSEEANPQMPGEKKVEEVPVKVSAPPEAPLQLKSSIPSPPPVVKYYTFSPLVHSIDPDIFYLIDDHVPISYSSSLQWEKLVQALPRIGIDRFCLELLQLSPRRWYLDYLSVTFAFPEGIKVLEQFNWLTYALARYLFYSREMQKPSPEGLPGSASESWHKGFIWKGIYVKLYYIGEDFREVKKELTAIRKLGLELAGKGVQNYVLPIVSTAKHGTEVLVASPCIMVNAEWRRSPENYFAKVQLEGTKDESPVLSKLTHKHVVPIEYGLDKAIKYAIIKAHSLFGPQKDTKCLLYVPSNPSIKVEVFHKIPEFCFDERVLLSTLDGAKSQSNLLSVHASAYGWNMQVCALDKQKDIENRRANSVIGTHEKRILGNAVIACFYPKEAKIAAKSIEEAIGMLQERTGELNILSLKELLHRNCINIRYEWLLLPYLKNDANKELICIDILLRAVKKAISKKIALEFKTELTWYLNGLLHLDNSIMEDVMEALFFSQLKGLNNSIEVMEETKKSYLIGQKVLEDILQAARENPSTLLFSAELLFGIKFDKEVMRNVRADKYTFLKAPIEAKWIILVDIKVDGALNLVNYSYLRLLNGVSKEELKEDRSLMMTEKKLSYALSSIAHKLPEEGKPFMKGTKADAKHGKPLEIWTPSAVKTAQAFTVKWLSTTKGRVAVEDWTELNATIFNGLHTANGSEYLTIYSKLLLDLMRFSSTTVKDRNKVLSKLIENCTEGIKELPFVPPELLVFSFSIAGICYECMKRNIEAEQYYAYAFLAFLQVYGDPRGRGNPTHPWGLLLTYKLKALAEAGKRTMDVDFMDELFETIKFFATKEEKEGEVEMEVDPSQIMLEIKGDEGDALLQPFVNDTSLMVENGLNPNWFSWLLRYSPMQNLTDTLWSCETVDQLLSSIQPPLRTQSSTKKAATPIKEHRSYAPKSNTYCQLFTKDTGAVAKIAGSMYVWGTDSSGQLGLASSELFDGKKAVFPKLCFPLKNEVIRMVSCGRNSSFAITAQNEVYAWGSNEFGQLGLGKDAAKCITCPAKVKVLPRDVKVISSGIEHSVALCESGQVFAWGNGDGGLLGLGDCEVRNEPTLINGLKGITKISCGGLHTVALAENGSIYAWGRAEGGQLGFPERTLEEIIVAKGDCYVDTPMRIDTGPLKDLRIMEISCGEAHTLVLDQNGEVYGWGFSNYGQLGLGKTSDCYEPGTGDYKSKVNEPEHVTALSGMKVEKVIAGSTFSLFITASGELYGCGVNDFGQTGTEVCQRSLQVYYTGSRKFVQTTDVATPIHIACFSHMCVKAVTCGENHSLALSSDPYTLWSWGKHEQGQLGLGETSKVMGPRVIPAFCSVPIMSVYFSCIKHGNLDRLWSESLNGRGRRGYKRN